MMMRVSSPVIQAPKLGLLQREVFPITRTRICYARQLCFCQSETERELSTHEIRDILVDVVENFPNTPGKETPKLASPTRSFSNLKKLRAIARVSKIGVDGHLPPHTLYLLDLGLDLDQIKSITHRYPDFAYCSIEGKIKPVVEFLLDLGVNQSDIPTILRKRPQLCGISLTENLIPTMTYLESLGVNKKKWAKVIYRFPTMLTCSRQKLKATVDFFYELGLTSESVGKVLTRFPAIVGYSVEENLRPTSEYFRSLGVDVAVLVYHAPQVLGLSIEGNLKPVTEFFLEKGYTIEEVGTMFSKFGFLFCYSLVANIKPKWEFFLTMDYPMSTLVKFPQYFGYSLEKRIKPRYALLRESGVKLLHMSQVLSVTEPEFEEVLKKRAKKKLDGLVGSNMKGFNLNISDVQIETSSIFGSNMKGVPKSVVQKSGISSFGHHRFYLHHLSPTCYLPNLFFTTHMEPTYL